MYITRALRERWRNARLLKKLMVGCVAFLVLPVLTTGVILFAIVLPIAQNESREAMGLVVAQYRENVRYRIDGYQNILAQLSLDPRLAAVLTESYAALSEAVGGLQEVNALLLRINSYFPMRRIYIYESNPTLPEDGGSVLDLSRAYAQPWYMAWQAAPAERFHWFFSMSDTQEPSLNVCGSLREYWGDEPYGFVRLEIPCALVFDGLGNPLEDKKGWIVLLDGSRRVLAPLDDERLGDMVTPVSYIDEAYAKREGWTTTTVDGKQHLVVFAATDLGWEVIAVASQEVLLRRIGLIRSSALAVSTLFVVLTFFYLAAFGSHTSRRLDHLVKSMREVRNGSLGLQIRVHGTDEIASTEREFNEMSRQLETTLRELASARAHAEEEELRLLQAQINPHFLYNTLSLVKYMALDIGAEAMGRVVDTIARFYRLSLSRGREILSVREELEHVRTYLEIHELRYPGKVVVRYSVDPEVLDAEIMKMTLQPIVENSLVHAFTSREGRGTISIEAAREEGVVLLRTHDDGSGMTPERIREVLLDDAGASADRGGFGVRNVDERLRRHFGRDHGLRISSERGVGTSVEIRIPFRRASGVS